MDWIYKINWQGKKYKVVMVDIRSNVNYVITKTGRKFSINDIKIVKINTQI